MSGSNLFCPSCRFILVTSAGVNPFSAMCGFMKLWYTLIPSIIVCAVVSSSSPHMILFLCLIVPCNLSIMLLFERSLRFGILTCSVLSAFIV